jgi:hypothetical protein
VVAVCGDCAVDVAAHIPITYAKLIQVRRERGCFFFVQAQDKQSLQIILGLKGGPRRPPLCYGFLELLEIFPFYHAIGKCQPIFSKNVSRSEL